MADISDLLAIFDLDEVEDNVFRGPAHAPGRSRVFGGHLVAQALAAAYRTIAGRPVHALHANFLVGGDPSLPIIYAVERLLDGGSFSNRRVTAVQHGRTIFTMSASFQKPQSGFDHQMPPPHALSPAHLPDEGVFRGQLLDRMPVPVKLYFERERPIELRPASTDRYTMQQANTLEHEIWMRPIGPMPADPVPHHCILAYASDFTLLDTALVPHGRTVFETDIRGASLDHSVWFHRPFRFEGWHLYAQDTPSASGGRGFARGRIYTQDGVLIASTAQEGLIRRTSVGA